jgi:hypothetical protein
MTVLVGCYKMVAVPLIELNDASLPSDRSSNDGGGLFNCRRRCRVGGHPPRLARWPIRLYDGAAPIPAPRRCQKAKSRPEPTAGQQANGDPERIGDAGRCSCRADSACTPTSLPVAWSSGSSDATRHSSSVVWRCLLQRDVSTAAGWSLTLFGAEECHDRSSHTCDALRLVAEADAAGMLSGTGTTGAEVRRRPVRGHIRRKCSKES